MSYVGSVMRETTKEIEVGSHISKQRVHGRDEMLREALYYVEVEKRTLTG